MAFFSKKKDEQIEVTDLNLPSHIGIIMDGNGRWAKKRGLPRKAGHRQGAKTFSGTAVWFRLEIAVSKSSMVFREWAFR